MVSVCYLGAYKCIHKIENKKYRFAENRYLAAISKTYFKIDQSKKRYSVPLMGTFGLGAQAFIGIAYVIHFGAASVYKLIEVGQRKHEFLHTFVTLKFKCIIKQVVK